MDFFVKSKVRILEADPGTLGQNPHLISYGRRRPQIYL